MKLKAKGPLLPHHVCRANTRGRGSSACCLASAFCAELRVPESTVGPIAPCPHQSASPAGCS